jgi:hypothetical protein
MHPLKLVFIRLGLLQSETGSLGFWVQQACLLFLCVVQWIQEVYSARKTGKKPSARRMMSPFEMFQARTRPASHWISLERQGVKFYFNERIFARHLLPILPLDRLSFDLEQGLKNHQSEGIALVFFMGLGDYLFINPFLRSLRSQFSCPIWAYVPFNTDKTNSGHLGELLKHDPYIDQVHTFEGKRGVFSLLDWRNYDFSLAAIPENFLGVPILYEYFPSQNLDWSAHRLSLLYKSFGMQVPQPGFVQRPLLHTSKAKEGRGGQPFKAGQERSSSSSLEDEILTLSAGSCGVVFFHLETRSTGYRYPYVDELIGESLRQGWTVLSATRPVARSLLESACVLDLAKSTLLHQDLRDRQESSVKGRLFLFEPGGALIDLIGFLKSIAERSRLLEFMMVTSPSVFGAVAAGIGCRHLQFEIREDPGLASITYPGQTFLKASKAHPEALRPENILVKMDMLVARQAAQKQS